MSAIVAASFDDFKARPVPVPVVLVLTGMALLLGGWLLDAFILILAIAAFAEFVLLARDASEDRFSRFLAVVAGSLYLGFAAVLLMRGEGYLGFMLVGTVVGFEILARFGDRALRGPKIAPSIRPSRTWVGFGSGVLGASLAFLAVYQLRNPTLCRWYYDAWDSFDPDLASGTLVFDDRCHIPTPSLDLSTIAQAVLIGALIAIVAQSGDLLARWIARKAGMNEAGSRLLGQGGVIVLTGGVFAGTVVAYVIGAIVTGVAGVLAA